MSHWDSTHEDQVVASAIRMRKSERHHLRLRHLRIVLKGHLRGHLSKKKSFTFKVALIELNAVEEPNFINLWLHVLR